MTTGQSLFPPPAALEIRPGDLSLTGSPSWHNAVYQLLSQLPITPFSPTRLSLSPSNDWNLHILNISASPVHTRHHGFDLLRVIAIYMVMQIHTGEFEYISPAGTVLHTAGSWAVGWTNSLLRVCVPLFVLITGFFLFPIEDERKFFRKRFTRVLIPFVIWCAVYAFYSYAQGAITLQTALLNIAKIPVNYGTEVGHLWFVYMLMAIYLIAPVFSPWIVSASRRSMELFLALWGVTLTLPFIHLFFADVWGECYWNATPTLYYFSGFVGYAVLAAYIKRFWMAPSSRIDWLAIAMIVVGYSATAGGFLYRLRYEHEVKSLELTWNFTSLNVAVMAAGLFLLFRNIHGNRGNSLLWRSIDDLSRMSYGMYLAHIIVLNVIHTRMAPIIGNAFVRIPAIAFTTFLITYLGVKLLSLLPGGKYVTG
jgi:surface polysaccharide O-acyltransferase-like enzyme